MLYSAYMNRGHITFAFIIYYALEFSIITDIYRSKWILEIISFLSIVNVSTKVRLLMMSIIIFVSNTFLRNVHF